MLAVCRMAKSRMGTGYINPHANCPSPRGTCIQVAITMCGDFGCSDGMGAGDPRLIGGRHLRAGMYLSVIHIAR